MSETFSHLGAEKVRAPGGIEQQRAARANDLLAAFSARGPLEEVGEMMVGVAVRRDGRDLQAPGGQRLAVLERACLARKRDGLAGRYRVDGARCPGKGEAAAHIVVVDVSLENGGYRDLELGGLRDVRRRVSLRVDHHAHRAVADEVAAVTKALGVEGYDRHGSDLAGRIGSSH